MGSAISSVEYGAELRTIKLKQGRKGLKRKEGKRKGSRMVFATMGRTLRRKGINSERSHSQMLDKSIRDSRIETENALTVMLLGMEHSGKETLLKLLKLAAGSAFESEHHKKVQRPKLYETIIKGMQNLLGFCDHLEDKELIDMKGRVLGYSDFSRHAVPPILAEVIWDLWKDQAVQKVWLENRAQIPEQRSLEYFLANDNIMDTSYEMTVYDWLHCHTKPKNQELISEEFHLDKFHFRFLRLNIETISNLKVLEAQLEGQTDLLIYTAALDEYDIHDNSGVVKLETTMEHFEESLKKVFEEIETVIVVLTKQDLLVSKLLESPFSVTDGPNARWADYTGTKFSIDGTPEDYDKHCADVISYIEGQFRKRLPSNVNAFYSQPLNTFDVGAMHEAMNKCQAIVSTMLVSHNGLIV